MSMSFVDGPARRRSRWIVPPRHQGTERCRLFCLPFAGGGASTYRAWAAELPADVAVYPVQLPGREERFNEPAYTDLRHLAQVLAGELRPHLDTPYAVFGHSMGALLTYELLGQLHAIGAPAPQHVFLSSYLPPQHARRWAPIHHLPDEAFVEEIRRLGGTPDPVLQHPELLSLLLPTLRADFQACETYVPQDTAPLPWPVTVYGGTRDAEVPPALLAGWQVHTAAGFTCRLFDGNHFYFMSSREALLEDIRSTLQSVPAPPSAHRTSSGTAW
jgi:surfactin synthase thioesterase subunit